MLRTSNDVFLRLPLHIGTNLLLMRHVPGVLVSMVSFHETAVAVRMSGHICTATAFSWKMTIDTSTLPQTCWINMQVLESVCS
ncbi:unnamed protein product [Gongylonema pulchrum]|uniref:Secreted protein n=1 Tax=Gongylonema pulchrum TaxID=637853 RepID=A0A183DS48_9BILA|nr:unnamed protein product [Gongylonema pulchrum]